MIAQIALHNSTLFGDITVCFKCEHRFLPSEFLLSLEIINMSPWAVSKNVYELIYY